MEVLEKKPILSRLERAALSTRGLIAAYDGEFRGWIKELEFHENLRAEAEKLALLGKALCEEADKICQGLESGDETWFRELAQAIEDRWQPHLDDIRRVVATLMAGREFRTRLCWIQLRDKATLMIMILEELNRIMTEPQEAPSATSVSPRAGGHRGLGMLLADEVPLPNETDRYDSVHLKLHGYMLRDDSHEDTKLIAQIKKMLSSLVNAGNRNPYRVVNLPGFVQMAPFLQFIEVLIPLRKVFEEGLEKYGQEGLPTISYLYADDFGPPVKCRILFNQLLRNIDTIQKVVAKISHDIKQKDAITIYFEPPLVILREIRMAAEFIFRDEETKNVSPFLDAIRKLIPLGIKNLKALSNAIAVADY